MLVNRLGIRDAARLDLALNDYATVGWFRLRKLAPSEASVFEYQQIIEMFGSLLNWAGELRQTGVQATGTGIAYAHPEDISESLLSFLGKLQRKDFLTSLDSLALSDRLADRRGYRWKWTIR